MKRNLVMWLAAIALLLSGCASVPMATSEHDAAAKKFEALRNKGTVYIYRNETLGTIHPLSISVNGKLLGQTLGHTYFMLFLNPGDYTIESHAEDETSLPIKVEAGKTYFVWQEVKMGMWAPRSQLHPIAADAGKKAVEECSLIASATTGDQISPENSGAGDAQTKNEAIAELKNLKALLDDGVLSQDEYTKKKKEILDRL